MPFGHLATPQRGNTQDVALRAWLKSKSLSTTLEGGGDVQILPQENAQTLETFKSGQIDGAWVPEPWATRLVVEGGGKMGDAGSEGRFWSAGLLGCGAAAPHCRAACCHQPCQRQRQANIRWRRNLV